MTKTISIGIIISKLFAFFLLAIGVLNIVLVHPVPGIAYLILSLVYLPQANNFLWNKLNFQVMLVVKIILGIAVILFTFGVSDLGDMIDKL